MCVCVCMCVHVCVCMHACVRACVCVLGCTARQNWMETFDEHVALPYGWMAVVDAKTNKVPVNPKP